MNEKLDLLVEHLPGRKTKTSMPLDMARKQNAPVSPAYKTTEELKCEFLNAQSGLRKEIVEAVVKGLPLDADMQYNPKVIALKHAWCAYHKRLRI